MIECSCGYMLNEGEKSAMANRELDACPSCKSKFEITVTEGTNATLPNHIDFDLKDINDADVVEEVRLATVQMFNNFDFDPDDFIVDISIKLKNKALEQKYILTEEIEHPITFIQFRK